MKKTILIVGLVLAALIVFGVGAVFAQDENPPVPFGHGAMMNGGAMGPMHTFMVAEFAKQLDLNVDDVNTRLAAGESMYDIALSGGVTAEEFPAFMTEVRANGLAAAVKANVLTQEQADLMLSHEFGQGAMMNGAGFGGMMGNGSGAGGMMGNGSGTGGMMGNGSGAGGMMGNGSDAGGMMGNGYGSGGMMNGWGSQQVNP